MRKRALTPLIASIAVLVGLVAAAPAGAQYSPDPDTVLLDALDGTSAGAGYGSVEYAASLPGLGQAVDLDNGDWIEYAVPSWTDDRGTIEAWINPAEYGYSIALLQWYNTTTAPSSGYVGHFNINDDGHLQWRHWGSPCPDPNVGSSIVPIGEWTHVAVSWGADGTNLYVNGILDSANPSNCHPPLLSTTYVYVNDWGNDDHGLMDELRISSVARSEEEIRAYVVETVNHAPVAEPAGPYLGAAGAPIAFDGTASWDPDGNTLAYLWDFGDGTTATAPTPTHTYAGAGIYDVCLTVDDGYVGSDQVCTQSVVYDPDGGFVTGGGWIDSPEGAYTARPESTGKATFGFVSKYRKGANVPTGNTEFQFKTADLDFHSTSYDWLVVTGSHSAKFKGTGTINGGGAYEFQIWAGDGTGAEGADTFRIKIWAEDEAGVESVVYDNGTGQTVGGGSIIVHTKK